MKKFWWFSFSLFLFLILLSLFSYFRTSGFSKSFIHEDLDRLPNQKVGLMLGTIRFLSNGQENLYFKYRVDAVLELYKAGKIEYVLVSGDNRKKGYNEPEEMQKALMERGIPEEKIILDYAGFRTLDSMVRAQKVFGLNNFICVSQQFHNERAIYIARKKGIEAHAYNARDVTRGYGFKTRVREVLARVKMMLDIYIIGTEPKFLGESVKIGL